MPFPIPIEQTDRGLKISDVKDMKMYASLFVTLAMKESAKANLLPLTLRNKITCYDSFCPSVQTKLLSRSCTCGRYFSSISSIKSHQKANVSCKTTAVKPLKILFSKESQKLVLVAYDKEEDVEWVNEGDLIMNDDEHFVESGVSTASVFSIDVVMSELWESE